MTRALGIVVGLLLTALAHVSTASEALTRDGRALAAIALPADATPAERGAADLLRRYIFEISGAALPLWFEGAPSYEGSRRATVIEPRIFVGATRAAHASGLVAARFEPEAWHVSGDGETLIIVGGRHRGVIYAALELLERWGVRRWTPIDEELPRDRRLRPPELEVHGMPIFRMRDLYGSPNPFGHGAWRRLNGQFARLPDSLGGHIKFGLPYHVHTFNWYVDPAADFGAHPEYFSEIGGFRFGGEAQLCLTEPAVTDRIVARLLSAHAGAQIQREAQDGREVPRIYSVSQNDWGRPCECARCSARAQELGGEAGLILQLANEVAKRIAPFELEISTLAYQYSFEPPQEIRPRDNVWVRVAPLHQRDFAHGNLATQNAPIGAAFRGWAAITEQLHAWDYLTVFGPDGDLPRAALPALAADLRGFQELDIRGVLLQLDDPVLGDFHDLKHWVASRLLEDPNRDWREEQQQFLRGYYGPAAEPLARYRAELSAAQQQAPRLDFDVSAAELTHLDAAWIERQQARFEAALSARRLTQPQRERVEHARVALDRLHLATRGEAGAERAILERRVERVLEREARRRLPDGQIPALRERVRADFARWRAAAGGEPGASR